MTTPFQHIIDKLEHFIRKYYINELLKGGLLFVGTGLLYFLLMIGLEYFFWFGPAQRLVLFWLGIGIEVGLLLRFVFWPVVKLLKLAKGIDYFQAAAIIGEHFSTIEDHLINLLELKASSSSFEDSDLLLASIDQRAKELRPIPFNVAINFRSSLKYLKFLVLPVVILLGIWAMGKMEAYKGSYKRLVNYKQVYSPPPPFEFKILNSDLTVDEGNSLVLQVGTLGKVRPQQMRVHFKERTNFLTPTDQHTFQYTFEQLREEVPFYLEANGWRSPVYTIKVHAVPKILTAAISLSYPAYLQKEEVRLSGIQDLRVPEGTTLDWKVKGVHIDRVKIEFKEDRSYTFEQQSDRFRFTKQIFKPTAYVMSTANKHKQNFEPLQARIEVIKDQYPELQLKTIRDSLERDQFYFHGQVSDDYGISAVRLVYFSEANPQEKKRIDIPISKANYDEFFYSFPDTVGLKSGEKYRFYFEVFDNDGLHGPKRTKSKSFLLYKKTKEELKEVNLNKTHKNIIDFDKIIEEHKQSDKKIDELKINTIDRNTSDFKRKTAFREVVKKERAQLERSGKLITELEKNLKTLEDTKENEVLRERIERQQSQLKERAKLWKELEKYQQNLEDEAVQGQLDRMRQEQKTQYRSLESLVELTKRLYLKQRMNHLIRALEKIKIKQQELLDEGVSTLEKQEEVQQEYKNWRRGISALEKENETLKSPRKLPKDPLLEERIEQHLDRAVQETKALQNNEDKKNLKQREKAQKEQQQSASKAMEELVEKLRKGNRHMEREQLREDAFTLRQILSNVLKFSFDQEDLMGRVRKISQSHPALGKFIQHQQGLKENFKHVEDSLFAVAIRNNRVSDRIYKEITSIDQNMQMALENLSKDNLLNGVSNQRYVLTASNVLANLLADALQNMEMDLNAERKGQSLPQPGDKFQLEDIIKAQEEMLKSQQEAMEQQGEDVPDRQSEEERLGKQFDTYKNQVALREKLNAVLDSLMEKSEDLKPLQRNMQELEDALLEENPNALRQKQLMENILKQMLRLKDADYEKEKTEQRASQTNRKDFEGNQLEEAEEVKKKFNSEEVLMRQVLPLQYYYQRLVKDYFQMDD